jgi:uncharacterized membrane protein YhhN
MKKLLSILYALTAVIHIFSEFHPLSLEFLMVGTKALLMPLLLVMFLTSPESKLLRSRWLVVGALAFSWAGDLLLTQSGELWFMLGIGTFLLAQVSYSVVFVRCTGKFNEVPLIKRRPAVMLAYMLFGIWVFMMLRPELGPMELPVLVYCIAILVMGITAANRFGQVGTGSFWLVWAGSTLFITSDNILAFNKFSDPIPLADELWVMLTYVAAQFLIVRGLLAEGRAVR